MIALDDGADKAEELAIMRRELDEVKRQSVDKENLLTAEVEAVRRQTAELETDKESLNSLIASYQKIEVENSTALAELKRDHAEALDAVKREKLVLQEELEQVRGELAHCQDEALKAMEDGYQVCWDRAVEAGYDMEEHTFAKYCEGLAVAHGADGSSNQAAGP